MHGARVVPPIARLLLCMDDHVGKALGLAYKFYTAVATILHCWRDQVRAVYTAWSRMFPDAMPKIQAPPKPIQQRWGRAVDCAKFLLSLDRRNFIAVFTGVLTGTSYYKDYTPPTMAMQLARTMTNQVAEKPLKEVVWMCLWVVRRLNQRATAVEAAVAVEVAGGGE